jgi:hypothetical protein
VGFVQIYLHMSLWICVSAYIYMNNNLLEEEEDSRT